MSENNEVKKLTAMQKVDLLQKKFDELVKTLESSETDNVNLSEIVSRLERVEQSNFKELVIDEVAEVKKSVKELSQALVKVESKLSNVESSIKVKIKGISADEYFGAQNIEKPLLTGSVLRDEFGNELTKKEDLLIPADSNMAVEYKQVP